MADDVRDVLMMMKLKGAAIPAECSAAIGADDTLAQGFVAGSAANNWQSNFFALRDFKMEMGLLGDTAGDPVAEKRQAEERMKLYTQTVKQGDEGLNLAATRGSSDFARFMARKPGGSLKSYSSNLEPVTINKYLDISSLSLFKYCINSTTIDSAAILKRRGSGENQLSTYLRIDFTDLLITDFNWDEEDVVTEKLSFVCRSAKVQYRVEQASGKMSPVLPEQKWSVLYLGGG
jgi:type VI protein secretion system component Hcp